LSAISRFCYLSRQRWREKYEKLKAKLSAGRRERERLAVHAKELERANDQLRKRVAKLEEELQLQKSSAHLVELPLGTRHHYRPIRWD
jgi:predicted nuclease with TOPRIM domain